MKIKVPVWFYILAVILLIWNLLGLGNFYNHVTMTDEKLLSMPQEQRALFQNFPVWALVGFALAVFGGIIASVLLLLKKKIALQFFIISLVGIIIHLAHSFTVVDKLGDYGFWIYIMAVLLITLAGVGLWLTKFGMRKGFVN